MGMRGMEKITQFDAPDLFTAGSLQIAVILEDFLTECAPLNGRVVVNMPFPPMPSSGNHKTR